MLRASVRFMHYFAAKGVYMLFKMLGTFFSFPCLSLVVRCMWYKEVVILAFGNAQRPQRSDSQTQKETALRLN